METNSNARSKTFTIAKKAYRTWLEGQPFVPRTAELLGSAAWKSLSLYARRLIDALEREHLAPNGQENAYLKLTYRQMRLAGIHNDKIRTVIAELETVGLVTVTHRGAYRGGARNDASTYRLNYLPWKCVPATGCPVYYAPDDEWKKFTKTPKRNPGPTSHSPGAISTHTPGALEAGTRD